MHSSAAHTMDAAAAAPTIRRLLVRLVLFVYVPLLVAAMLAVGIETRNRLEAAKEDLVARTALLSRTMRFRLEGMQSHLERLAQKIPAERGDWATFYEDARSTALVAALDTIILHRPDGSQVINTYVPWGDPLPKETPRDLMPAFKTGRPAIIGLTRGPLSGRMLAAVSVPVIRQGRLVYELTGTFNVERLQELFATTPPGWIAGIVDAGGAILARSPGPEDYVGRPATAELLAHTRTDEQGVYEMTTMQGVPVLTAFRTPPSIGWTILLSVPRSVLYASAFRTAGYLAAGAAVLLTIALWAAARLSASIARSVESLAAEAEGKPDRYSHATSFREAQQVRERMRASALKLAAARRDVERMDAQFHRRLIRETHRHQATIAAELHDDIGSSLAGITLLLEHLRPKLDDSATRVLDKALDQVARAAQRVRSISRGILPAGEHEGGLPAAIEQLTSDVFTGGALRCDFHWRGDFGKVPPEAATHLYRIAQEALANSARHADATRVRIMLSAANGYCRLTIDDDGTSYPQDASELNRQLSRGAGLNSMRARTLAIDGDIQFTRSPLGGWRVRVIWPHPWEGASGTAAAS